MERGISPDGSRNKPFGNKYNPPDKSPWLLLGVSLSSRYEESSFDFQFFGLTKILDLVIFCLGSLVRNNYNILDFGPAGSGIGPKSPKGRMVSA
jgi:hypothetical protein